MTMAEIIEAEVTVTNYQIKCTITIFKLLEISGLHTVENIWDNLCTQLNGI